MHGTQNRTIGYPLAAEDIALDSGAVLAGRYRILEPIGEGGMGTVYLGEHLGVGRRVAVKVLSTMWATTPDAVRRFRAEARAAGSIGHPNIVEVFDVDQLSDGRPFLVMEVLDGIHLLALLERTGPLPWRRVCQLVSPVARALAAAHAIGIIHRDLKAENVMVVARPGGEVVKVLDFGVAVNMAPGEVRATTPGVAVGTPIYMAPEQARGKTPTPAFDLYAVGVLMFELLCGEPPFVAENPLDVLTRKLNEPAPSIGDRVAGLPSALVAVVDACLARDPADRPESATVLADRLDGIEEDPVVPVAVVVPPRRTLWLGGAATLAAVAASAWMVWPEPAPVSVASPSAVIEEPTPERTQPTVVGPAVVPAPVEIPAPPPVVAEPVADTPAAIVPDRPRPKPRASPLPSVAEPATPKPATPEPVTPAPDTADCARVRREAEDARLAHDWHGLLRHTEGARCWKSTTQRTKLRVKANMELSRFSECARLGKDNQDVEVVKWVQICRKRLDADG